MNQLTRVFTIMFISTLLISCSVSKNTIETTTYTDNMFNLSDSSLNIKIQTGEHHNHPSFVIWQEDMAGNYLKTLFITKAYASGIFGHQMVGDSVWLRTAGESFQPAALPFWTVKKGLIDSKELIPTPKHPFIDAYSGATPKGDFSFKTGVQSDKPYRIILEVNQPWDWNEYWTNNKYPENEAYKHSAQPSVVYAVSINKDHKTFYMNPIGHGDPKGEGGKLYTDISKLDSAKEIFESIVINISK